MRTYDFNGIKKTLKKNTFELEEQVKDVIGATDKNEKEIVLIQKEFASLEKGFNPKMSVAEKRKIAQRLVELNEKVLQLTKNIKWSDNFQMCLNVMDVLLVEGSVGLTKKNFGRFDAQGVWNDFFSAPQANGND